MTPQAQYFYNSLLRKHLMDQPVLDVDPSGEGPTQITHEGFIGWGLLKGI
jgi:hypothetical protein